MTSHKRRWSDDLIFSQNKKDGRLSRLIDNMFNINAVEIDGLDEAFSY